VAINSNKIKDIDRKIFKPFRPVPADAEIHVYQAGEHQNVLEGVYETMR